MTDEIEAGSKWLKVRKELYVVEVNCSNGCVANARFTLRMPCRNVKFGGKQELGAGDTWTAGIRPSRKSFRYLKRNFRKSALKVAISAVDSDTGKRVAKTRSFRFRL